MSRCPSDLGLEEHLLDPAVSPLAPHLASCARCQLRLDEMQRIGDEFGREVYPATVDAVVAAVRPRSRGPRWLLFVAPVPALAVVLFLVATRGPSVDYSGLKGSSLGLSVFTQVGASGRLVADGGTVPASAALRFQVRPPAASRLWLVSVDAVGQISRLFPAGGEGGAEVKAPGPLPGGAVLDGRPGPERIYAVCTRKPLPFADLERAARASAGASEATVRAAGLLKGLPAGAVQASLLLEKRP
jgi:hypothetical protein